MAQRNILVAFCMALKGQTRCTQGERPGRQCVQCAPAGGAGVGGPHIVIPAQNQEQLLNTQAGLFKYSTWSWSPDSPASNQSCELQWACAVRRALQRMRQGAHVKPLPVRNASSIWPWVPISSGTCWKRPAPAMCHHLSYKDLAADRSEARTFMPSMHDMVRCDRQALRRR